MSDSLAYRMTVERKAYERDCELAHEDSTLERVERRERELGNDERGWILKPIVLRRNSIAAERATLRPLVVNYELSKERTV